MNVFANSLIVVVAVLHLYFLYLEMFQWTKPKGLKIFGQSPEQARQSAVLAANQGLYNGFLAAGLAVATAKEDAFWAGFFLVCVIAAGAYGGYTVSRKIFYVQAGPALLALAVLLLTSDF